MALRKRSRTAPSPDKELWDKHSNDCKSNREELTKWTHDLSSIPIKDDKVSALLCLTVNKRAYVEPMAVTFLDFAKCIVDLDQSAYGMSGTKFVVEMNFREYCKSLAKGYGARAFSNSYYVELENDKGANVCDRLGVAQEMFLNMQCLFSATKAKLKKVLRVRGSTKRKYVLATANKKLTGRGETGVFIPGSRTSIDTFMAASERKRDNAMEDIHIASNLKKKIK